MAPIKCLIKIKFGIPSSGLVGSGCKYDIAYNARCEKCKHFSVSKHYVCRFTETFLEGLIQGIEREKNGKKSP